jgi:2-methylcitrate dehydratase PrpD
MTDQVQERASRPTGTVRINATNRLVTALRSIAADPLPAPVVTHARLCLLDVLGVLVPGGREPAGRMVRAVAASEFPGRDSRLLGQTGTSSPAGAALVNGTAAHALDFDDVLSTVGHPSAVVVPAALAVAEQLDADGGALLAAVVTGIETQALVAAATGPSHYARGFHSTATFGTFAAAASAATLRGLDDERFVAALGIAGTQAAGLKAMFGTMTKPFHAGRAASSGVLAAALAAEGFTAAGDVLGAAQGFAATQSDAFDVEALRPPAEAGWRTCEVQFKMHAACYLTHASIDALSDLRRSGAVHADDVAAVEVAVPPGHLSVCAIPEPVTGLEGKFSLRYTAALALTGDRTGPTAFTDELVREPGLVALRDRVAVVPDATLSGPAARVTLTLRDGRTVGRTCDLLAPEASADTGSLTERLLVKFHGLVDPVLGAPAAERLATAVLSLSAGSDVRELTALTVPSA